MTVRTARIIGAVSATAFILSLYVVLDAVFDTAWETVALPLWVLHFVLAVPVIPFAGHGWITLAIECLIWSAIFGWGFGERVKLRKTAKQQK